MNATVQELVAALTLEEKAGLCSGEDFWHTKAVARLGIPAIKVSDGPTACAPKKEGSTDPNDSIRAVCFPAGCAAAASFDPALTRRMGAALGREARAEGVQVLLGPPSISSAARCAAATLNIIPKTPIWPGSWPQGSSAACRARASAQASSTLPPTIRRRAAFR